MDGTLDESGLNANGLTAEEQATFDNLYGTNPGTAEAPKPGFFTRAWAGAGGIPSGLANVGLTIYDSANNLARSGVDKATYAWQDMTGAHDFSGLAGLPEGYGAGTPFHAVDGVSATDVREAVDTAAEHTSRGVADLRSTANNMYRPDPETTGTAGNMLFGALEPITRIGVGSLLTGGKAGLEVAAGSMGFERTQELEAQGVDPFTAAKSGVVTAGTFEAMGAFGGEGGTLAQRVLKSAAINTGAGLANRALDSAVLNAAGYNKLAEQQQWNDAQAIISDAVIGMAFPLVHAAGAKLVDASAARSEAKLADKITQSPELFDKLHDGTGYVPAANIEAALTSLNTQHARDVAPGVPADVRSQGLHIRALDTAIQQVLNGDDVNVEPIVRGMNTIPRPMPEGFGDRMAEALAEDAAPDATSYMTPESSMAFREHSRAPYEPDATAGAMQGTVEGVPDFDSGMRDIVAANPHMKIPLEDGTVTTAAAALGDADRATGKAELDSRGLEAAALCAARHNDAI